MKTSNIGFSLLEILVTLCLIGILAKMIVPTYRIYTLKAEQSLAQISLLHLANALEEHYATYHSYENFPLNSIPETQMKEYELRILKIDQDHFIIGALPKHHSVEDQYEAFYLDQDGNKTIRKEKGIEEGWDGSRYFST